MPRALQAVGWTQRPLPWLERCHRRYGDVFTLRIRHYGDWVLLADPEDVKKVFTAGRAVGVATANPLLGPLLGPRSVMLLEEPEHMTRRKLMLPSFHGQAVQADAEMMALVARQEIARWPAGEPFALWPRMQDITLDVVMRAVFGPDSESPRLQPLRERLRGLTTWMNEPRNLAMLAAFGPGWVIRSKGYREAMGAVEEAVMEEVRRRKAEPDGGALGVVSMLVGAEYEDGSPLSDQDLRDELVTLLSDGPTSSTLAWTFERLLRNPDKLELLRDDVLHGDGTYLDAVVKETLRLRPPVPVVVRTLLEPMRLGGYDLPAGTTVAPCIHLIHRDARWYEQPERFLPERFVGKQPGTYTWIPFGGGRRRCLGASFAILEMKTVLREVVSRFDVGPGTDRPEVSRRRSITISPRQGASVVLRERARVASAV
jgi:cytochrome P450